MRLLPVGIFPEKKNSVKGVPLLMEAVEYSFFSGGKRFRPLLCYAVGESFKISPEKISAFALAVECVHTYSLIHDDLPCMDNDEIRRGQPTTHKKFSEDIALLAGDSLLTESFSILSELYPDKAGELIKQVAFHSGLSGLICGQVLDLGHGVPTQSLDDLIKLHRLKTGSLMTLCFQGPFILSQDKQPYNSDQWEPKEKNKDTREHNHKPLRLNKPHGKSKDRDIKEESILEIQKGLTELGFDLGLAFQIKDDLLDFKEDESFGFVSFLGLDETRDYLESLNKKIKTSLKNLGLDSEIMETLVDFNEKRGN